MLYESQFANSNWCQSLKWLPEEKFYYMVFIWPYAKCSIFSFIPFVSFQVWDLSVSSLYPYGPYSIQVIIS